MHEIFQLTPISETKLPDANFSAVIIMTCIALLNFF